MDQNLHVVERYLYDPFGTFNTLDGNWNGLPGGSPYAWSYLHQGLRWNAAFRFYDNRSRWYDPASRRFIQRDRLGYAAGDTNLYRYQFNSPTQYTDASGHAVDGAADVINELVVKPSSFEESDAAFGRMSGLEWVANKLAAASFDSSGEYVGAGQPAFAEGFIPFWGSGRAALDDAQNGRYGSMVVNATFFALDAFLIGGLLRNVAIKTGLMGAPAVAKASAQAASREGAQAAVAAGAKELSTRARVLANIAASKAARDSSKFTIHVAIEGVYSNARTAVAMAKNAGLTNKFGRLGTEAHQIFRRLNDALSQRLSKQGVQILTERFRDRLGLPTFPRAAGSKGLDALIEVGGKPWRGFDLKTGRLWSQGTLNEIQKRFRIPVDQLPMR